MASYSLYNNINLHEIENETYIVAVKATLTGRLSIYVSANTRFKLGAG